jgi:hypothetical protein
MDIIREHVGDMLAVEQELHQMFRNAKEDSALARFPAARALLQRIEDTTDRNLSAVQACMKRLGGESPLKKAVGAALGAASGLWQRVRQSDSASRILRDGYGGLNFAIVCYEMLHTTALAVADTRTAEMALGHLKAYAPLVVELSDTIPQVVIDELAAEGKVVRDSEVAREAVRNAREAWHEAHPS